MLRKAWTPATLALLAALVASSVPRGSAMSVPWFQQMGMKLHSDFLSRPRSADGREAGGGLLDTGASFRADVDLLAAARPREESSLMYFKRTGTSMSVLWSPGDWDRYVSPTRYFRHLMSWPFSKTAAIIAPVVSTFTAWSAVVCLAKHLGFVWTMPLAPLSIVSSAVVLLLTLRTNQALNRMLEARSAWGRAKNYCRVIAGFVSTRVAPVNPSAAFLSGRLLCSVGWSLRSAMLSGKIDQEALDMLLPPEEAEWVGKQSKPALAALDRLSHILRAVADDPEYAGRYLSAESHRIMLENIGELDQLIGTCERLIATPVPPTYTRFTSRVLLSWLACIPLSLVGAGLPNFAVILGTLFTSYVMIGIDEIAIEIEEPMRLLPLNDLCCSLMSDVTSRIVPKDAMPPLKWHKSSISATSCPPLTVRQSDHNEEDCNDVSSCSQDEGLTMMVKEASKHIDYQLTHHQSVFCHPVACR